MRATNRRPCPLLPRTHSFTRSSALGGLTLWRPAGHSGCRPAGHLARDSSRCELEVRPGQGSCVCELRIPWREIGASPAFGGKLGFPFQPNDNDGAGPAAQRNWGGGLSPAWDPAGFGVVAEVE